MPERRCLICSTASRRRVASRSPINRSEIRHTLENTTPCSLADPRSSSRPSQVSVPRSSMPSNPAEAANSHFSRMSLPGRMCSWHASFISSPRPSSVLRTSLLVPDHSRLNLASLERPGGKAPDKVLLEDKEEDYHGDGHYQAPRGGELILSRPTTREQVEARGEHLILRSLQVYQWQQKVVPRLEEHQNRQTRHRQRQHNAPEDLELRGAFDPGGVSKLLRQVHVERPHQEHTQGQADPGGAGYGGEDHRRVRAQEAQALQLVEEGDHHGEERDHEPHYEDEEDDVVPGEVETRQCVTRQ